MIKKCILSIYVFLLASLVITNPVFAQTAQSESKYKFGPFASNFEMPAGWKSEDVAIAKAKSLFANDGIDSDLNLAISAPREGLLIVSWQYFDPEIALSAGQLASSNPSFEFVKKSDVKVTGSTTNNANQFDYAITKAAGSSNDNLTFSAKGKSRLIAYWINLPIQLKNAKGESLSGMLTVFYRGNDAETKRNRVDSVIASFMDSLSLDKGFAQISYEKYKEELTKGKLRKELEKEMASGTDKNKMPSAETITSSTLNIKDIYAVDQDGNCYRPTEKEGLKKTACPVHKSK